MTISSGYNSSYSRKFWFVHDSTQFWNYVFRHELINWSNCFEFSNSLSEAMITPSREYDSTSTSSGRSNFCQHHSFVHKSTQTLKFCFWWYIHPCHLKFSENKTRGIRLHYNYFRILLCIIRTEYNIQIHFISKN